MFSWFCAACSTKHQPIKVNGKLQKFLTFLTYFCSFGFKELIFQKLNSGFGSTGSKTKISCFYHWINGEGMGHIESWKNSKTLIHQSEYDRLEEHQKEGKYSSESIESYFTLFELLLAPKSNPLLAVEELHFAKQGSMTSGEFHSHIVKIAK